MLPLPRSMSRPASPTMLSGPPLPTSTSRPEAAAEPIAIGSAADEVASPVRRSSRPLAEHHVVSLVPAEDVSVPRADDLRLLAMALHS